MVTNRVVRRTAASSAWLLAAFALLCGCSGYTGDAGGGSVPPTTGVPPSASTGAAAIVAGGTARQNLPVFRDVVERVWASRERAAGRAYIDALVKAGFSKGAMQVTKDRTTVGNPAESIQFSVLWKDGDCLVGQVGPATGDPVTVVMGSLPHGRCLIGDTRPIDW